MSKQQWIKENLKPGEHYAGLILGKDGAPDYHLIGLPGEAENVTWEQAKEWAKTIGGELPTLRELSLERTNAREHFRDAWYWSSEARTSDSDYAWLQTFSNGGQHYAYAGIKLRARAVRRIYL